MAESSLTLAYFDLANEVSNFLGYPSDLLKVKLPASNLTPAQKQQQKQIDTLHRVLKSGLRQFYFPPAIQGTDSPTDWSFLHPTAIVDLPSQATAIQLPEDFGGIEGQITISPTQGTVWWPITIRNEGYLRNLYALYPNMVSRPMQAALTPLKGTTVNSSSRMELLIFPKADQDYRLQLQYYVLPDYLSGAFPYAYGGAAHAETLLESCLAIAEQKLDDAMGVHTQKFQERLVASIGMDRKNKAQNLGPNLARGDLTFRPYGPYRT